MIKNIVFDLGGVIIDFDIDYYILCCTEDVEERSLIQKEVFNCVEWIQLDRGTISTADAIVSINKRLPDKLHQYTNEIICGWYKDIQLIEGMYDLIAKWKKNGYHIYLLSNTTKAFHEFREKLPSLRFFEGVLISADCGHLKPEHEIYDIFFERFGLVPAECIFIDNNPSNVEGAINAGMSGIVFHGDASELDAHLSTRIGRRNGVLKTC